MRLQPDDQRLLREHASARGMPVATYVSVLVRSHLRGLARLPNEERLALKESVAELAAIGRNFNQIARTYNQGGRVAGPTREDLRAILKACQALHGHVTGVLKANAQSQQRSTCEPSNDDQEIILRIVRARQSGAGNVQPRPVAANTSGGTNGGICKKPEVKYP